MDGGTGGIGYQMSIPHGHGNGFMPHQSLDAVYVFAIAGQPACKGMPEAMKYDTPGSVVQFDAVIEADGIRQRPERMGKVCTHVAADNRRKNQSGGCFFILLLAAFFKNAQSRVVQRHFTARLSMGLITHCEHGMNHVHVRPFQALKFAKPQAGVQRKDYAIMQVYAGQLLCGIDQGLYFLGSQESFTGISYGGNLDATNGILSCEDRCSVHFREAGLSESIIYDAAVLLDSRGGGTGLHQVINDSLNIFSRDDRQGFCANGRFDDFVEALLIGKPAPLGSLGFRHVVPLKEVLEGHMGNVFFRRFSLGGGTFGSGLFPHFGKALWPSTGLFVLFDSGQHLEGFFCVPLLRGPTHAFFDGAPIFFIADGVVAVGLPVALLAGRVLVVTDSGVRGLDFWLFHAPTMPPLLGENKGAPGNLTMTYPIEITIHRKSGEVRNQIQGLVKVPSWEFESPLRHHKKVNGLAEQSAGPFCFFVIVF